MFPPHEIAATQTHRGIIPLWANIVVPVMILYDVDLVTQEFLCIDQKNKLINLMFR